MLIAQATSFSLLGIPISISIAGIVAAIGAIFFFGWRAYQEIRTLMEDNNKQILDSMSARFGNLEDKLVGRIDMKFLQQEKDTQIELTKINTRLDRIEKDISSIHTDFYEAKDKGK